VASVPIVLLGADHPLPSAILAIGLLAVLNGGLHLDGLADTLDAVAAPPGSADRARTDPRAGTAGVIAIAIVLGLDAAALAELAARGGLLAPAALVAAAVVSRVVAPVWAVTVGRRLRPSSGLGAWFADATSGAAASVALASAVLVFAILVELAGPRIVVAAIGGGLIGSAVAAALVRLRRQLDGDGYGALIEATLSGVLLAAMVVG
jgi:adenosylcobinamide-GDP ribazoletransferase